MKPHLPLRVLSASLLCACALAAHASPSSDTASPLADCVDLGPDRQIVRGDTNKFFVRSGDAQYRVKFRSSCGSMSWAPRIWISTDGQDNRLCPKDTRVSTGKDSCRVGQVDAISAEEFDRRAAQAAR